MLGVDDPSSGVACEKDAENGSSEGRLAVEIGGLGESTITDDSIPEVHSAPAVVWPPSFSPSTLSKDSAPGRPEGEPRIVLLLDDEDEVELSAELDCEGGAR